MERAFNDVLYCMDKLRSDVISGMSNTRSSSYDYLHLTENLASLLKELLLKDPALRDLALGIAGELERDDKLLSFPFCL